MCRNPVSLVVVCLAMVAMSVCASVATADYTPINVPGAAWTSANGVDSSVNTIVGYFVDAGAYRQHGFVDVGGSFTTIDAWVGAQDIYVWGVSGTNVVGWCYYFSQERGFIYNCATTGLTQVLVPNSLNTFAACISGNTIGGWYYDKYGSQHGFLDNNGVFTTIDVLVSGATDTSICGISSNGKYVGTYSDVSSDEQGFFFDGAGFVTLSMPNVGPVFPSGIDGNNIVGSYIDSSGNQHGFLDNNGVFTTIDVPIPGTNWTGINGISGNEIVGTCSYGLGDPYSFSREIPEPVAVTLFCFGAVVFFRRRRRV